MSDAMAGLRARLRHEPAGRRVRALLGGHVVADTTGALLVWEPRRITPVFAVPAADLRAELTPAAASAGDGPELLHPGIPFAVHSTAGEALTVTAGGATRPGAAFRPADPDLAGHVLLDFDAFDWLEEDEPVRAHPRDPYHRVDARATGRRVRLEHHGRLIADTTRAVLVFETSLPVRYYLPRAEIAAELTPSALRTYCPYKGEASYFSAPELPDVAWSYPDPLPGAPPIAGLIAFYDDLLEVSVDGERRGPVDTPVTRALRAEFGV
ncbi:hypothetical protein Sya03_23160 [Spirilliplanes yamanashiensis]|uniref:DUF427 domain-containing protein n=2 Tax=Spirilliplanes yamanashiensis TaxID=42233 RepID=A0A8J3Y7V0_9ACTN|nr:hypothetical protein Sya03_23160 [Spirilliplanes yamanashiensis]